MKDDQQQQLDLEVNQISEATIKQLQLGILVGLVRYKSLFAYRIKDIINRECFHTTDGRFYFDIIFEIVSAGCDVDPAMFEGMVGLNPQHVGHFNQHRERLLDGLQKICERQISEANAYYYAQVLARRQYKNRATSGLAELIRTLRALPDNTPSEDTEAKLLEFIRACASGNTSDDHMELIGKDIQDYIQELIDGEEGQPGIDIGFPLLSEMCGGILPGTVHVIASRMKMGKSSLCLNIAINAAINGYKVLYLDMEMQKRQQQQRMLANMTGLDLNWIKYRTFKSRPEQIEKLKEIGEECAKLQLTWRKCAGMSVDKYLAYIQRWVIREVKFDANNVANPCLVVIDYIKKTGGSDAKNDKDWEILGSIANKIKGFATEIGVPIFSAVQLNRQANLQRGDVSNIAGSDIIAREVDTVVEYVKKTDSEIDIDNHDLGHFAGNRAFIQTAVRDAEEWDKNDYIAIEFNGPQMRYFEHGRKSVFAKHDKVKTTRKVKKEEDLNEIPV